MATWRITAPRKLGRVREGESFIVVTRTTGTPDQHDIEEVLYTNGYKEDGGGTARSYRASGNWTCEKISDDTYPAWYEQHERYEKELERDKIVDKYKKEEAEKKSNNEKVKKGKKEKSLKEKEGCLTKLWKAPFRLLWWLIKQALVILSLGMLSAWLNNDK